MEWPGQVPAWALLGVSAVAAIAYGIRRNRPNAPVAWWFLGAGVLLFITGDTTYKFWHQILGQNHIPFPSFIDAIYVTMYPVLAVGLLLLARARVPGGDRASLLDALNDHPRGRPVVMDLPHRPERSCAPGGCLVRLTAAAYPLGDILVLAMLAHLWSSGGLRHTAGRLLAIGAVGTLVSDSLYGLANLHPSWNWSDGNPIDPRLDRLLRAAGVPQRCTRQCGRFPSRRPAAAPSTSRCPSRCLLAAVSLDRPPAVLLVETAAGNPGQTPKSSQWSQASCSFWCSCAWPALQAHQQAMTREQVLRKAAWRVGLLRRIAMASIRPRSLPSTPWFPDRVTSEVSRSPCRSRRRRSPSRGIRAGAEKVLDLIARRADVRTDLSRGSSGARVPLEATIAGDRRRIPSQPIRCSSVRSWTRTSCRG